MRTALPAPALLRRARVLADCRRRNDLPPRAVGDLRFPGLNERVTIEQARSNPHDFIRYIEQNP